MEPDQLSPKPTGVGFLPEAIQVWTWPLDPPPAEIERCGLGLAPDECERVARFRFERDRRRFAVCRSRLRTLLGRLLDTAPGQLRFRYGPRGKPYLADSFEDTLQFNVAHSGDRAVCAVSRDHEVGVDIEELRDVRELVAVSSCFFSPLEQEIVLARAGKRQLEEFLRLWTLKEALVKAIGEGIAAPLGGFEIVADDHAHYQLRLPGGPGAWSRRWNLYSWSPVPGFVAAIAIDLANQERGRDREPLPPPQGLLGLELGSSTGRTSAIRYILKPINVPHL